jgi:hypothetical protein
MIGRHEPLTVRELLRTPPVVILILYGLLMLWSIAHEATMPAPDPGYFSEVWKH